LDSYDNNLEQLFYNFHDEQLTVWDQVSPYVPVQGSIFGGHKETGEDSYAVQPKVHFHKKYIYTKAAKEHLITLARMIGAIRASWDGRTESSCMAESSAAPSARLKEI
jgi:hypothetical protein